MMYNPSIKEVKLEDNNYRTGKEDIKTMRRAAKVEALLEGWKYYFHEQIKPVEKIEPKADPGG
ncbi:MAG: hypothetical protein ACRD5J_13310 [Nitrososphaeraceae archaeon]